MSKQSDKYIEQIKTLTCNVPIVRGGGKGWTAEVGVDATFRDAAGALQGETFSHKDESKEKALAGLLVGIAKMQTPGLETEGMTEAEVAKCVSECVDSSKPYCECKCGGHNHGTGPNGYIVVKAALPMLLGPKACACGCGEMTNRRFAPGHDARFHAREKREKAAAALGVTVEEYVARKRKDAQAAINEKAKARRAAKVKAAPVATDQVSAGA